MVVLLLASSPSILGSEALAFRRCASLLRTTRQYSISVSNSGGTAGPSTSLRLNVNGHIQHKAIIPNSALRGERGKEEKKDQTYIDSLKTRIDSIPKKSHRSINSVVDTNRRNALGLLLSLSASSLYKFDFVSNDFDAQAAVAPSFFSAPPYGFRYYLDRFDGYFYLYPDTWVEVKGAGQDCFFRNPLDTDENLSVNVSSPSSSKFKSIRDLGSPSDAADRIVKQYLTEFMSTRLGVSRQISVVSATSAFATSGTSAAEEEEGYEGEQDGKGEARSLEYYFVETNVKSFANNNQLAITPEERVVQLEWERNYLSVLAVAPDNGRLYELRIQSPARVLERERDKVESIARSFRVYDV